MSPTIAPGASAKRETTHCPQCERVCDAGTQFCPSCGFPLGSIQRGDPNDRFINTTLPAGYHILDLIGVGGMGRVYRAEQSVLGRTVAVKIIHPHLLADENSAVRFLTEARAASQLNHPNSISVFDFGRTEDGQPYLVMELLRGKDLGVILHEEGELPLARIVDVLRQVLAALGQAHDLGIVHRDLKPENIILQPQRRGGDLVKVLDFGLAKLRADVPTKVTSPGIVCGTPDYMAPEQGRGDHIDGRSDLYAVGVMLFQLLTGRLPFEGDSPTQVVMMHLSVPAPDPRQVAPRRNISPAIAEVVKRALAKSPGDRFSDAHEFAEALEEALSDAHESPRSLGMAASAVAPSLVSGETVECEACGFDVPRARFCCECAAPLPQDRSLLFPAPFLGRAEELSWLESRRPNVAQVAGVRIVAEPGAGKSRLLDEFSQTMSAQGDQIILVNPDPHGAKIANHAVSEAIVSLARLTRDMIDAAEFRGAGPEVQRGLHDIFRGTPRSDMRSPMERRHSIASALRWALVDASSRGPGMPVLILDDMDRMDGGSLHAFADVLGDPPAAAALFVGAHQPGFDPGWGAERTVARVLPGLKLKDIKSILPGGVVVPPGGDEVLPLYLDQALRYHFEGGTDAPTRIGDLIHRRLETLDADARRVLQGLSILGFSALISDVAELMQLDGVEESIHALLARGMITLHSGRVMVSHPMIRQVTLSAIPAEARRQLHRRALRIEDRKRGPLEARAAHAYECQESFQALLLLEQVADRATAIGDTEAEVFALRQGLEIARREISRGELDDPMRAVLIFSRKLGASLTRAGDFSDADGILRESLDLAGPTSADRAKILGALAHVSYGRKRYDEALVRLEHAIAAAQVAGAEHLLSTLEDTKQAWTN